MISIIYRKPFIGNYYKRNNGEENVNRLSGRIRGEEMVAYLGANSDQNKIDSNDVTVWVKPVSMDKVGFGGYVDILDIYPIPEALRKRPDIKVIVSSQSSFDYLSAELPNKLFLIPSHHVNHENITRTRNEIEVAGYIGNPSPTADALYGEVANKLKEVGYDFKTCFNYKVREDAINFYKQIDIFVIADFTPDTNPNKVPTKIINAASFGIPVIAFPLQGYKELDGFYIKATDMNQVVSAARNLKNKKLYKHWAKKGIEMSKKYHISNVAKLYRELK